MIEVELEINQDASALASEVAPLPSGEPSATWTFGQHLRYWRDMWRWRVALHEAQIRVINQSPKPLIMAEEIAIKAVGDSLKVARERLAEWDAEVFMHAGAEDAEKGFAAKRRRIFG